MKKKDNRSILLIGTSLDSPGGMTAVANTYLGSEIAKRLQLDYLPSYLRPGALTQARVMLVATSKLLYALILHKVALLHVHSASRGSFWRKSLFCMLARCFGVPYVFHVHSGEFPVFYRDECSPRQQRWVRHTLSRAAAVVVLTPGWLPRFNAIAAGANYVVVGNPIDVPERLPEIRSTPSRVLFLGRLREKKGVYDLLQAIPPVLARFPGLKFVLAGDGELDRVRAEAIRLGISDAVETPGWIAGADKDRELALADIFVLPSYFEGLPICVLEAMAQGVPVIATRVGGIPDVVEDGVDGVLAEAGNIAALSDALLRVIEQPGLRQRLRVAAYQKACAQYATAKVLAEIESVYRTALGKNA